MLYLFNSAFRPKYTANVLNTFFLDNGSVNEYRYTFAGTATHVEPEILNRGVTNKETIIVFIDRFHRDGFYFHPIRRATFLEVQKRQEQAYFRVKLGDFIYPKNPAQFQGLLRRTLQAERIPQPVPEAPQERAQGFFALQGDAVADPTQFLTGDDAWGTAVESLARTQAFATIKPVFAYASIWRVDSRQPKRVVPSVWGKRSYYSLARGGKYRLSLYYRFPHQEQDPTATLATNVNCTNLILPVSPSEIAIASRNCTEYFDFRVKKYAEEDSGSISVNLSEPEKQGNAGSETANGGAPLIANASLIVEMREAYWFYPLIIAALLAYGVFGALTATDFNTFNAEFSKQYPAAAGLSAFFLLIWAWLANYYFRILGGAGQALVLLLTLRLLGKKVL